jgi:hypothetical protein
MQRNEIPIGGLRKLLGDDIVVTYTICIIDVIEYDFDKF